MSRTPRPRLLVPIRNERSSMVRTETLQLVRVGQEDHHSGPETDQEPTLTVIARADGPIGLVHDGLVQRQEMAAPRAGDESRSRPPRGDERREAEGQVDEAHKPPLIVGGSRCGEEMRERPLPRGPGSGVRMEASIGCGVRMETTPFTRMGGIRGPVSRGSARDGHRVIY
jgi:hypothetical protein